MIKEFRDFIMRGNVLDLAVGIIIGAAFTAVVTTLVNNIIMPPIGLLIGGVDFSNIVWTLRPADAAAGTEAVTIGIGVFINAIISFLITALAVFLLIKSFNEASKRLKREKAAEAAADEPVVTTDDKILAQLEMMNATLDRMAATPPPAPAVEPPPPPMPPSVP